MFSHERKVSLYNVKFKDWVSSVQAHGTGVPPVIAFQMQCFAVSAKVLNFLARPVWLF